MAGSIILYASLADLSADHQEIFFHRPDGVLESIFVRAVHAPGVSPLEALDIAKPLEGETFLNSIPDGAE